MLLERHRLKDAAALEGPFSAMVSNDRKPTTAAFQSEHRGKPAQNRLRAGCGSVDVGREVEPRVRSCSIAQIRPRSPMHCPRPASGRQRQAQRFRRFFQVRRRMALPAPIISA